jgi:iron complex outermembrane recepter protein
LVLIDGRTVYTPLYSGVFWDVQAVMPRTSNGSK